MTITVGYKVWSGQQFGTSSTSAAGTTQAAGSTFVVFAFDSGGADDLPTGVTDNKGNTYHLAQTVTFAFGNGSLACWYCINGSGGSGHTATATYAVGGHLALAFTEFIGVGAGTFDLAPAGTDSGSGPGQVTSWAAPSILTSVASELVVNAFCTFASNTQTITDASPFSIISEQATASDFNGAVTWAAPATISTVADTIGLTTADYVGALAISIKPVAVAPGNSAAIYWTA